jgi:predicted phage terminase large subunit-like protein
LTCLLDYFEAKRPRQYGTEWHDRWVCLLLQRAYEERKNLVVEMHPRSGKSEKVNLYAPAWWLQSHPEATFGLVTSEDGLAAKFVSGTRRLLSAEYQFDVDRQNEFKIAGTQGLDLSYTGRGIHSNLSGRGFDCLMLDDCLKSGTDAMSENIRERLWTDVVSAAVNRLSPQGIVIALQARLHQLDVIGKLLDTGMKFMRLHLPAVNDSGEAAWFEDGYTGERTVFPPYRFLSHRYPRAKLEEIQSTVTPYYWMAQYQQAPSLGDLAFFRTENLPRYEYPGVARCWTAWDCAQTATKGGSYSAGVSLGLTSDARLQILDVRRGRWPQDRLEEEIFDHARSLVRLTGIFPEAVIVERAAAGYGIIDRLSGILPIIPLIPKGSKEDRAASVCSLVNRGMVELPTQAPWLSAFLEELTSFPLGRTKDQVDAFVHALSYCSRPSEFAPVKQTSIVVFNPLAGRMTEEELIEHMEYIRDTTIGGDQDW